MPSLTNIAAVLFSLDAVYVLTGSTLRQVGGFDALVALANSGRANVGARR